LGRRSTPGPGNRVASFSWENIPKREKYTKLIQNYQIVNKYTK
jgi:hypothetical protein